MNYLYVKAKHLCSIFSRDSGKKDLQTTVCVCVQIFTQIKKERERGVEDGCKEKIILRNVLRY